MLIHSSSTGQLNSYYLQKDSMDRYSMELKMFFFHMDVCLFLFIYSILLSLICTYLPGVCNLVAISFFVINFLLSQLLVTSVCQCGICSNRKEKLLLINFKINVKLTRGENCKLASALRTAATFKIKDVELFAPLVILSTKNNVKLAKQ